MNSPSNAMPSYRSRGSTDWLLLAGFCGLLFYFGLASFGLVGADEPRYAQVAREMFERHDWVSPTLGGKAWLEKPPLYYWQAMAAYAMFGVSDRSARLPCALDASLMVAAVYLFLRRFRNGLHLDGALITASATGVIAFARAAGTDMPLAATFTLAMLAWYAWWETSNRAWLAASYFLIGLASLAKGPVAPLLAALILVVFSVWRRESFLLRRTLWVPGVLVFCATSLPWYIAVQMRNPEFFRVFILEHNLARFGTNLYHHPEPFWYYVPIALLSLIPWTVFVVVATVRTLKQWREEIAPDQKGLDPFLVVWLLVPVLFFSLSKSKLPGYILPAAPAGTILLAEYLRKSIAREHRPRWLVVLLHSVAAAAPLVPAVLIPYIVTRHRIIWGPATLISIVLAVTLAIGIGVTLRARGGLRMLRFVTLIPVLLAVVAAVRIGAGTLNESLSARPVAEVVARIETQVRPLAVFRVRRETEYGLAFYRNQTISRYERGELPATEHLLIAPEGSQSEIAQVIKGRRMVFLGTFAAQHLDYYWIAGSNPSTIPAATMPLLR